MTTQDIFAALRARAMSALAELLPDLPPDAFARVQMEPPRDPAHGDMATNAAMVVAKAARQPPPKLAAALAERLSALPEVAEAAPAEAAAVDHNGAKNLMQNMGLEPDVDEAGARYLNLRDAGIVP